MRRSTVSALVGWEMILKKAMVLAKSSRSSDPPTYGPSVGSRKTAERVSRLPHWLWTGCVRCAHYKTTNGGRGAYA
jgi:hypothetical protein